MPQIQGKQLADSAITTIKINAGAISADAAGRAKLATGFFDAATASDKFAASSIALSLLAEAVLQADGGQALTADLPAGGFKITGLGAPTADNDAARKAYVDTVAAGLSPKPAARLATAAALPAVTYDNGTAGVGARLTASAVGVLTVDGVAVVLNDLVIVKNQASALQNGHYKCTTEGTAAVAFILTRSVQMDEAAEVPSAYAFVQEGTANADKGFVCTTNAPVTMGTTAIDFTQFTGMGSITAGAGLTKTGDTIDFVSGGGLTVAADSVTVDGSAIASTGLGTGASAWQITVLYGAVGVIADVTKAAASAGVADTAARADHKHDVATAVAVAVSTANSEGTSTSLARADHVHDSPASTTGNKNIAAIATVADNDPATAVGGTVAATPALDSYVGVFVNGIKYRVGDGVKTLDCYFAADALGATAARAIAAIASGDYLHWVGSVAGFQLAATDVIELEYPV